MRRLILLRHAKTEPEAPSGKDRDRRLDDRGHDDAATIGGWIVDNDLVPDTALISTATRAQQTWAIIGEQIPAEAPQPEVENLQDLYGAGPSVMLQLIRETPSETKRLLLVGHNPGLHELALALTGHRPQTTMSMPGTMPTAGVFVIDFSTEDWSQIGFGDGLLEFYTSPKLLKAASHGA
jgi:phosphohistidine phosphatase